MNSALDDYCAGHEQRFVEELIEALRIPSISADPGHAADVRRNAEAFRDAALRAGFQHAELIETAGHPAVYAELITDLSLPTVLIYGHHDVQPVDPLDEWVTPPFEPTVREGDLMARGAVDDKGQVFMHLKALEAQLAVNGRLPLNLKLIVEGEEEIGSVHFDELVEQERERLACDVVVVSDTAVYSREVPSLTVALRGLAALEVEVTGPSLDLHSGIFGGTVRNPVEALARMLASLKDPATDRVTVPGFYDSVRELTADERARLAELPFDAETYRHEAGDVPALVGERGYTPLERRGARPTLEINGIWGGYQGPGSKTIIPSTAGAKITCRLVPNQTPAEIAAGVRAALEAAAPEGVTVTVRGGGGGMPVETPIDHPAIRAASDCIGHVFGHRPVFVREGGSIPPVETFQRLLGVPAVLLGVGLPDDRTHAPNEKFSLEQYHRGIRTVAHLWDRLPEALRQGARD